MRYIIPQGQPLPPGYRISQHAGMWIVYRIVIRNFLRDRRGAIRHYPTYQAAITAANRSRRMVAYNTLRRLAA